MNCNRCGADNPKGALYCNDCGTRLSQDTANQNPQAENAGPQQEDPNANGGQQQAEPSQRANAANNYPPPQQNWQQGNPMPPYPPPYAQNPNYAQSQNYAQNQSYAQNPGYQQAGPQVWVSGYNRWIAFVLCLIVGVLGIHRFYVGKIGTGILYIFTGGLFGIGWLIDLIMIACGSFTDSEGLALKF